MAEALIILAGFIAGTGVNIAFKKRPAQDPGAICVFIAIAFAFMIR